jgi:hypothetical protein
MKYNIDDIRAILASYELGARVSQEHFDILYTLLQRHPNAAEKIGSGVHYFSVGNGDYGTHCFYIHRNDDTVIDFSFRACFKKARNDDFPKAARKAIEPSIRKFRATLPESFSCPIDGSALTRWSAHIDHAPPNTFKQIVKQFKKPNDIQYAHDGIGVSFVDKNLAESFVTFHDSVATLRGISKEANQKLPKI